jgi:hypothetical protein
MADCLSVTLSRFRASSNAAVTARMSSGPNGRVHPAMPSDPDEREAVRAEL